MIIQKLKKCLMSATKMHCMFQISEMLGDFATHYLLWPIFKRLVEIQNSSNQS